MIIRSAEQDIEIDNSKGKVKITLEINFEDSNIFPGEKDPAITKLTDQYLKLVSAYLSNILYFYEQSPILATYLLGEISKELMAKNEHYRTICKGLKQIKKT